MITSHISIWTVLCITHGCRLCSKYARNSKMVWRIITITIRWCDLCTDDPSFSSVSRSRLQQSDQRTTSTVQSETNWVCTSNTFSNLLSVGQYRKEVVLYVERYAASLQRDKSRHRDSLIKRHLPVAFWEINFWPKFGFSDFFNQILNSGMGKTFGTVIELRRR